MKITVHQKYGLGNQLFQYAAGRYYQQKYNAKMELTIEPPREQISEGFPRPFLLSRFNITASVRRRTKLDQLISARRMRYKIPASLLRKATATTVYRQDPNKMHTFQEDLPVTSETRNMHIIGFWQVHQIPESVEEQLREEFSLAEPPTGKNAQAVDRILRCNNPISVHIRRSDYKSFFGRDISLPMKYYRDALDHLRQRYSDLTLIVFSDEIEAIKREARELGQCIFMDHNDARTAHEDLRLMSLCKHHIIANSTFSWWGAWLNPSRNKLVCAPKSWLVPTMPRPDLMPKDWVQIPV